MATSEQTTHRSLSGHYGYNFNSAGCNEVTDAVCVCSGDVTNRSFYIEHVSLLCTSDSKLTIFEGSGGGKLFGPFMCYATGSLSEFEVDLKERPLKVLGNDVTSSGLYLTAGTAGITTSYSGFIKGYWG